MDYQIYVCVNVIGNVNINEKYIRGGMQVKLWEVISFI